MSVITPSPDDAIRVCLVGKTGSGKSCLGRTLFNQPGCTSQTNTLDNRTAIQVIDVPTSVTLSFGSSPPGPHVFLYVITIDGRITTEECKCSFNLFRERFGKNVTKHTIIVLNRKPKDRNSTLMIQEMMEIITECHDRYVCLDDFETPSYEKCDGKLLKMILATVRDNGGSHYTREMYSKAVEQYNAKLKLEEDNRKLTQEVQELTDLLAKQELKNKRTGLVESGRLADAPYSKIRANYIALQEQIVNPRDICRELFSAFVFDKEDKRIIESEKDRIEQTDKLLMTSVERGQKAFDEFLLALSATGHHQAKQILEQDPYEDVSAAEDNRYLGMKITFPDLHYQSEYSDPNNNKYKDLKDELETLFGEYGCDATVISISSEPVTVSFVIVTCYKTDEDSVLEILRNALESGYLGHYRVSTDHFLFCRIGAWLTNRKTDNTEEVTPVIGDESLTEQQDGDVILDCGLTISKSDLNNLHPILKTFVKSGSIGPYKVSSDQFSIRQIGGRFNEKPGEKSDEQGAGADSVVFNESANIRKPDAESVAHSSSRADTSRTADVSVTPQTNLVMTGIEQHSKEVRVVLVGKTGRDIGGGAGLWVVDTPGIFDSRVDNDEISKESVRCIFPARPPAFLYSYKIFNHEQLDTLDHPNKLFGEEVMDHVNVLRALISSQETKLKALQEFTSKLPPERPMTTIYNRAPAALKEYHFTNSRVHYTIVETEVANQSSVKELGEKSDKQGQRLMELELREHFRRQVGENDGILLMFAKGIHNVLSKTGTAIRQTIGSTGPEMTGWL